MKSFDAAFPHPREWETDLGLTKREYAAIHILAAMVANSPEARDNPWVAAVTAVDLVQNLERALT